MSQIDEFESAFKSATKPVYRFEPVMISRALVFLDVSESEAQGFLDRVRSYLDDLQFGEPGIQVIVVSGDRYQSVEDFLQIIKDNDPELICTYRNLHIPSTEHPYSLGVYIDVMTQATSIPVLLFPRPELMDESREYPWKPERVIAVTDHLAGDSRLVNFAARFTQDNGQLTLVHVEDEQTFERFITVIGKIPDLDTDLARSAIMTQLLKEPADYIESCKTGLHNAKLPIQIDSVVTVGHQLSDYRDLLRDRQVDLVVMNTKDEDQLAMHGLAYPLSIEFRRTPLLLI